MQRPDIFRLVLFILFFSAGAASLGVSVLCEDLFEYYQNRQLVEATRQSLEKLKSLNDAYNMNLSLLEEDPNHLKRLAPAALGSESSDPNTVNPRVTARQLAAARKALTDPNSESIEPVIPAWLIRSSEPRKRMTLFFSGIALILISFICFRPTK
ncbi:MAG: hypothetical protein JW715_05635 [Sedimentisphaerales bacterium]|nr:hypothetical protein [Sedimentisphaerales bacterium]